MLIIFINNCFVNTKEHIKITNCAISKDGKYFITIMPSKMIVWNRSTGKVSM